MNKSYEYVLEKTREKKCVNIYIYIYILILLLILLNLTFCLFQYNFFFREKQSCICAFSCNPKNKVIYIGVFMCSVTTLKMFR